MIRNLRNTKTEKIPETSILATLLVEMPDCSMEKKISYMFRYQQVISEFLDFWSCASHRFTGKFTFNLCNTQFFKTKNSKISC